MSFSSVTMRSATFWPTPGERAIIALSRNAMALARSAGASVPNTESATLVPTPCTVCSSRNHSRSTGVIKPNSRIWSSRTWVSIASTTGSPGAGSACSVRAEQCTT